MPFLSVIIPVYNVEKYLSQCVDSVLNQHLQDYEIILVDDGSPDQCPQICDQYAAQHSEVHVIHQKNGGLSAARNAGMKAAAGEYIIFMDSDDWWNPDVNVQEMLKSVRSQSSVQMFLFTSHDYIDGVGYYKRNEHQQLDRIRTQKVEYYYQDLLANGNLEVSACTKILKRNFLLNNELFFAEGLLGEDNHWMIRVLRKLQEVAIINQPLYICRISRNDSITHTIKKKNVSDLLNIVQESVSYYQSEGISRDREPMELCFCSYLWFSALGLSQNSSKEDRKALLPQFKETASVCQYSNSPKTRLAYTVYKLFGIRITAAILGKYISLKGKANLNKEKIDS